ncbi:MAG: hypothetical protein LUI60_06235 [Clostridia bacterium]|nr:hypothetical protein [Clostridia bacterium]
MDNNEYAEEINSNIEAEEPVMIECGDKLVENIANDMNVMLLITDDYTYYSMPFIYSLIKNNSWADSINIYILTDALTDINRKIFVDCINMWGGGGTPIIGCGNR